MPKHFKDSDLLYSDLFANNAKYLQTCARNCKPTAASWIETHVIRYVAFYIQIKDDKTRVVNGPISSGPNPAQTRNN